MIIEDDEHVREVLKTLRGEGVQLAMDDFGTGYSSLSHLRHLPFDRLKIDRSFIRDVERDPQVLAVVRAVVALGKQPWPVDHGRRIETDDQDVVICREACHEAQGYLYARPGSNDMFGAMLERAGTQRAA